MVVKQPPPPVRPDELDEDPILEPPDLQGFFERMKSSFRMASSNFRRELDSFRAVPKESMSRLGTRFDEVADPLIENDQITARHLALHFVTHLPSHIRKAVVSCMRREDRFTFCGQASVRHQAPKLTPKLFVGRHTDFQLKTQL